MPPLFVYGDKMKGIDDFDFTKFDYTKKYHLHCDFDTPIYSCAAAVSKEPCLVTHKKSGRKKTFDNFDSFINFLENDEKGKKFKVDDFNVPLIAFALTNLKNKLETIIDHKWVEDFTLYVGGEGNFRKTLYPEYKQNRGKSPAMRKFCYNYVLNKWKGKVIVCHNEEAEDRCLASALKDKERSIIGFIDKDLTTQSGYFLNYNKLDLGVFWIDKVTAFYNLSCQLLHGDSTDNIFGITKITPELKEKYGIKTKSIGKATAAKLLEDVQHDKIAMKERIVDVYKLSYGDEWKEKLQFTGSLVFISKVENEYFNSDKFLKGVIND